MVIKTKESGGDSMLQETLDFCNEIRAELSLPAVAELSPGERVQFDNCPVANTIRKDSEYWVSVSSLFGLSVANDIYSNYILDRPVPPVVKEFIDEFDRGALSRFELSPEKE